ncbi:PAQR family membrane homeostasis protein TrhA [Porticoccus sp.]|uniref:PAQR family membrane homeostasis protein TrhA n=1 Tax=Porticoccus sp. TaxID=2024853 RepID=UPI003F6A4011
MPPSLKSPGRKQSCGEEIANSLSHGAGLLAALIATPPLIIRASQQDNTGFMVGSAIFALTMILLYLSSTLYHGLPRGQAKRLFQVIEHSAIFLLIAGTYTPFTLGVLQGVWGWTLLALIWCLAATGVILKTSNRLDHPVFSTGLYLLMGWLIVIAANPLWLHLPTPGLIWLASGSLAYTVGVAFFTADSYLRYGHFIWHLFVMAGTTCHYIAIFHYAA